jgi:drug/metabolite transporter (DMT)-like permease
MQTYDHDHFGHAHLWPGVPMALGAAVLFGLSTPLSKLLLDAVDPGFLAGTLYLGAGLGLAGVHAGREIFGIPAPEAPLRRSDLPWLAAVVLFGGVIGPLLLMIGLARTAATESALLLNLESLATMGIAWVVFRENVDRRLLLGVLAILVGAALLAWQGGGVTIGAGAICIAGACIAWGIDNNLTRKLSAADPVVIAMTKGLVAGGANILIARGHGAAIPSVMTLLAAATLGFFAIGVSLVLFILALRHLGTARTGAYFSLAPFIGATIAVLLLGEAVTPQLLAAGALMALGLWLHLSERHEHDHIHEPLDHEHAHVHDAHHRHRHDEPVSEPHSHRHRHQPMRHKHVHYPDLHHRHPHD